MNIPPTHEMEVLLVSVLGNPLLIDAFTRLAAVE
jgi:hypothetical protein